MKRIELSKQTALRIVGTTAATAGAIFFAGIIHTSIEENAPDKSQIAIQTLFEGKINGNPIKISTTPNPLDLFLTQNGQDYRIEIPPVSDPQLACGIGLTPPVIAENKAYLEAVCQDLQLGPIANREQLSIMNTSPTTGFELNLQSQKLRALR